MCVLPTGSTAGMSALFALLGFVVLPMLPTTLDAAGEATYPVSEDVSSGLLMTAGQLSGIVFVYVLQALTAPATTGVPTDVRRFCVPLKTDVCARARASTCFPTRPCLPFASSQCRPCRRYFTRELSNGSKPTAMASCAASWALIDRGLFFCFFSKIKIRVIRIA